MAENVYWPELALSIAFESGVGLHALPDKDGRDFWDLFMPDGTMVKVLPPRTWIRKSVYSAHERGPEGLSEETSQAIRLAALERELNTFALGAAVVAELESRAQ